MYRYFNIHLGGGDFARTTHGNFNHSCSQLHKIMLHWRKTRYLKSYVNNEWTAVSFKSSMFGAIKCFLVLQYWNLVAIWYRMYCWASFLDKVEGAKFWNSVSFEFLLASESRIQITRETQPRTCFVTVSWEKIMLHENYLHTFRSSYYFLIKYFFARKSLWFCNFTTSSTKWFEVRDTKICLVKWPQQCE